MADAELEADRLAAGQPPHLVDELQEADRGRERRMAGRRNAVLPIGTPRMAAISAVTFAAGSTPP